MATVSTHPAFRTSGDPVSLGAALVAGKKVPADVTRLLQQDHREAMSYFDWYEASDDPVTRRALARKLCATLRAHMQAEEEIFYPAVRDATGDDDLIDHAEKEHLQARRMIEEIESHEEREAPPDQVIRDLRAAIQEHVVEEEEDVFPDAREAGLDLYEIGRLVAGRKVEALLAQTGRTAPETHLSQESNKMEISQDAAHKLFVAGLRDIHAALRQGKTMLENQVSRVESYPHVEQRLREHLADKNQQVERVEEILESFGESRSMLKDVAMATAGSITSFANAATQDEILKNSLVTFGLTNFEIASFEALITLGAVAGHSEAVKTLQRCLNQERAMAAWLADNQRGLILAHLQLREEGQRADA